MVLTDSLDFSKIPLLVLAGGKATRLKAVAKETPKYLMPIEGNQTFADLHLRWARKQGFQTVILSVGHLADQIKNHCGDGSQYGLRLLYTEDGNQPLGTGGAVLTALQFEFSMLAVTYGDTLLNLDVRKFLTEFQESKKSVGMTVYKNEVPGHQCNIFFDTRHKTLIYDKVHPKPEWQHIDYGFLALQHDFLTKITLKPPFDLAIPLSERSYAQDVMGFEVSDRFWEIGTPEALQEFREKFGSY